MGEGFPKPHITWNGIWPPIIMKVLHIGLRVFAIRLMGDSWSNQHLYILMGFVTPRFHSSCVTMFDDRFFRGDFLKIRSQSYNVTRLTRKKMMSPGSIPDQP